MIVDEKVDRFKSNFGRMPTSIALAADWTTPIDATNIELSGNSFSNEKTFGDGLGGLGFANVPEDTSSSLNVSSFIPDFANWDWHEWALALGAGYTLYNMFKSSPKVARYKKRRELLSGEKEIYKNRRKKVEKDYPLFA